MAGLEARVLLTVGRRFDAAGPGPALANVRVEAWVDPADVLCEADLVVCHGGSGTAFGALAAGVPVVVVPLFADQFENGRRIAGAGTGLAVEAERRGVGNARGVVGEDDVPRIAEAVGAVLGTASLRRRAGRIAAEMAATRTVDEVPRALTTGAVGAGR